MEVIRYEKDIRCMDAAVKDSKNFASQNSCQESGNPWMDFRFHIFSNPIRKEVIYERNSYTRAEVGKSHAR